MSRGPAWFRQKAGRRDANHRAIVDGLEALGHFVVDLAGVGSGVPDIGVWHGERWTWLELKVAKGKLRASQVDWQTRAIARGIRVRVVRSLDEALRAVAND